MKTVLTLLDGKTENILGLFRLIKFIAILSYLVSAD